MPVRSRNVGGHVTVSAYPVVTASELSRFASETSDGPGEVRAERTNLRQQENRK
jgi:hypothetical protein